MKVIFAERARAGLERIFEWILADNPTAALAVVGKIESRVLLLETPGLEKMGRPGEAEGTREIVTYPYVIVYRVDELADQIVVVGIFHGAQDRTKT